MAVAASIHPSSTIPPNMAAQKAAPTADGAPANATTAGPGQIPVIPQPTPNSAAPKISLASTAVAVGKDQRMPGQSGSASARRRTIERKPGAATNKAPAITSAKEGSQHGSPGLKNAKTLAGRVMPL